jgi:hypothetical protein
MFIWKTNKFNEWQSPLVLRSIYPKSHRTKIKTIFIGNIALAFNNRPVFSWNMTNINKDPLLRRLLKKGKKARDSAIVPLTLFILTFCSSLSIKAYGLDEGFYLDIPYVHQASNYCGPAVLAMVFRYWDHSADQHDIAGKFVTFPRKGLSGEQLKQCANENGFTAFSFKGDRDNLIKHLRQGRPLIIALGPSFPAFTNHYVVVVGWIPSSEEWIIHDPSSGPYQRRSARRLGDQWSKLENWTLLVLPRTAE